MKKYNLFLVIIAMLAIANNAFSQQQGERISQTTLSIFNNSDKNITIKLGLTTDNLHVYEIKSQENWTSPTFPFGANILSIIKTNKKEVKNTLRLNTSYMIIWNNKKKHWELTKIKNGQ